MLSLNGTFTMSCLANLRCSEDLGGYGSSKGYKDLRAFTESANGRLALAMESASPELHSLGPSGSLSKL